MRIVLKNLHPSLKINRKRVEKALRRLVRSYANDNWLLVVTLVDDRKIRELNMQFRGENHATDVLAFPMMEDFILGDVIISLDTAFRQANERDVRLEEELCLLIVHGFLHLIGYDHVCLDGFREMKEREVDILYNIALEE